MVVSYLIRNGCPPSKRRSIASFTLVELLVAVAILLIIIGILFALIQETGNAWRNTSGRIEVFKSSRNAFDTMTRTLSQATLNTFYDYSVVSNGTNAFVSPSSGTVPTTYARNSSLQIVAGQGSTLLPSLSSYTAVTHAVFFQAPLGMSTNSAYSNLGSLLNACGFYVAYGPDIARPGFLPAASRYRYRLMQFLQPSEDLSINTTGKGSAWYLTPLQTDLATSTPSMDFVLAENVIALIILPKLATKDELQAETVYGTGVTGPMPTALAPNYAYDSSTLGQGGALSANGVSTYPLLNSFNQLPPVVQVTMVAIDEASALKLGNTTTPPSARLGLTSSLFTVASNYQTDLQSLEQNLSAAPGNAAGNKTPLNFRVFETDVAIRAAKWTSNN